MKRPLIAVLIVMLLATLACSINVNIPRLQTGATQTVTISEPAQAYKNGATLDLQMGGGTLNLSAGADGLVDGTINYNVAQWKPQIDYPRTGEMSITQAQVSNFEGIPTSKVVNDWQFKLNSSIPLNLSIKAGAYTAEMDMTGLHLRSLSIADGAAKTHLSFNAPNPEKMDSFTYTTGASQVELSGLVNANFAEMTFSSGAGDYTLDFSGGALSQDTSVDIKSGVANMTIIVPVGMAAKVTNLGAISNIDPQGTWTVNGSTYTVSGEGHTLTIHVNMSVGNLKLVHK